MDDSLVSMATQSKVRSYLVYELHQQKYHAHEPVAEKLTSKFIINSDDDQRQEVIEILVVDIAWIKLQYIYSYFI